MTISWVARHIDEWHNEVAEGNSGLGYAGNRISLAKWLLEHWPKVTAPAPADPAPTAEWLYSQIRTFRAADGDYLTEHMLEDLKCLADHIAHNWAQVVQARTKETNDRIAALERAGDRLRAMLEQVGAEKPIRYLPAVNEAVKDWKVLRQCPPEQPCGLKSLQNAVAADDYPDAGGLAPPPEGWQKLAQALSAKLTALEAQTEPRPDWPSRAPLQKDWSAQAAEILDRETERCGEHMTTHNRLLLAQVAATLAVAEVMRTAGQQPDQIDKLEGDLELARRQARQTQAESKVLRESLDNCRKDYSERDHLLQAKCHEIMRLDGVVEARQRHTDSVRRELDALRRADWPLTALGRKVVEMAENPPLLDGEGDALWELIDAAKPLIEKGEQDGE